MRQSTVYILICAVGFTALQTRGMENLHASTGFKTEQHQEKKKDFFDENVGNYGQPVLRCGQFLVDGLNYLYEKKPVVLRTTGAVVFVAAYYWWLIALFANSPASLQA